MELLWRCGGTNKRWRANGRHHDRHRRVLPPPVGGAENRAARCPFVHQDQLISAECCTVATAVDTATPKHLFGRCTIMFLAEYSYSPFLLRCVSGRAYGMYAYTYFALPMAVRCYLEQHFYRFYKSWKCVLHMPIKWSMLWLLY